MRIYVSALKAVRTLRDRLVVLIAADRTALGQALSQAVDDANHIPSEAPMATRFYLSRFCGEEVSLDFLYLTGALMSSLQERELTAANPLLPAQHAGQCLQDVENALLLCTRLGTHCLPPVFDTHAHTALCWIASLYVRCSARSPAVGGSQYSS